PLCGLAGSAGACGGRVFDDSAHLVRVPGLVPGGVGAGAGQCPAELAEFADGVVDVADPPGRPRRERS
ncbi:MAG: hypothetical protein ACRDNS_22755, partial [Trebonia sp.]